MTAPVTLTGGARSGWRSVKVAQARKPDRRSSKSLTAACNLAAAGILALASVTAWGDVNVSISPQTLSGRVAMGGELGFTFSILNVGSETASNVTATVGTSANVAVTNSNTNTAMFALGHLGAFAGVPFTFAIRGVASGTFTVIVEVSSDQTDSNTNDNTATATGDIWRLPDGEDDDGTRAHGGDPVSTFSGKELLTEAPDLNLGGPLPVFFQRHYDGALVEDGAVSSALGPNWQHNYELKLTVAGTNATLAFRQGRIIRFENDGANWNQVARTDIGFQLVETGGEFLLGEPRSQLMYFFDAGGLLKRIEDGRGNTNFLSYNGTVLTNVNDGLGRNLTFAYDGNSQLTNVSDGVRSVGFIHGSPLAGAVDVLGNLTGYSYTTNATNPALLTARTLPEGNTPVTQVYDAAGRVVTQVDAASNTNTFAYVTNSTGGLTNVMTDPLGFTLVHVYNEFSELSRVTDESGRSLTLSQDIEGRRSGVTDRLGVFTGLTYETNSGLPNRINHPGINDDVLTYSNRTVNGIEFSDLARIVRPDNRTNRFEYDAAGNLLRYFLRDGASFNYAHNNRGQPTSVTNPVGGLAVFTYDANARLATATDSDVGLTTYQYDALHRLTNVIHPDAATARLAYDALDRVTSVTDERGNASAFAYDRNSRLTNVTDALNQTARFEYDGLNRLTRTVDRLGNSTRFAYDPRSDLAVVTNRNGFVTRLEYDPRRFLIAAVNPAGKTNRFGYNNEGLLTSVTNPLGETVSLTRDVMGYVTGVRDALGNSVGWELDAMKRATGFTNALGRKTTNTYTARGQLSGVRLPGGINSSNQFDALGSLTNLIDPNNRNWNFAYTPMGRLARFADPLNRTNTYAYDPRGRLARVTYPDGVTLTNTYDAANNLTRRQYSDGTDLNFAFDALDRLTNATGSDPITFNYDAISRVTNTRQVGLDFGATYDADGRLTSVTYSNGLFTVTYAYDSRDRLTSVSDNLTGTTLAFGYDDADRLTSITRPNGVNTTYTYDAAGRLTRIQDGSIIDLQYTLDANGNVTEADYVAAPIDPTTVVSNESASFTYDLASQISSAGYGYDARGRLTNSLNTAALAWDGASRLTGISNVILTYNALDDLVTRVESGATNRFFYNYAIGLNPIMAERDDNTGQFTRFYVWSPSGLLLYLINLPGNTVSFPHFDRVGSTLALTGAGGTVTDNYAYDPYGSLLAQSGSNPQPFRFVGRSGVRHEPAGNLRQMRARYYDPQTARFLSMEPVWPALENPLKLNPYQYALRDPLGFIDPEGTDEVSVQKPVEEMNEEELKSEWVAREVEKRKKDTRREFRPGDVEGIRDAIESYVRRLRQMNSDWMDRLRKRVKELRDPPAAAPPAPKAPEKPQPKQPPAPQPGPAGGSVVPGGSVPTPDRPFPVIPTPEWFDAPKPAEGSKPPGGEEHGFRFGGAADGVPVSYTVESRSPSTQSAKPRSLQNAALANQSSDPTAFGGARRFHQNLWVSCAACHPNGMADPKPFVFPSGPRQVTGGSAK